MMSVPVMVMLGVLGLTAVLFISEWIRIDVAALLILVILGWARLVPIGELFSGFASNAVLAIIGVMIIGRGLDRSGITSLIVQPILNITGDSETRITTIVSGVIGLISGFLQNIGAMALFLPSILRVSKRTRLPPSRLLMPLAFTAILGGSLTMVGSSSLIVLNDLLLEQGIERFGLFDVTPLGLLLLGSGILYFYWFRSTLLPSRPVSSRNRHTQQLIIDSWDLPKELKFLRVTADSPLIGKDRREIALWENYSLNLLAIGDRGDITYAPWDGVSFEQDQVLILLGSDDKVDRFADEFLLKQLKHSQYEQLIGEENAGFAELIVPPRSGLVGKEISAQEFRETYRVEPISLLTKDVHERGHFRDDNVQPGDTFIVHGFWKRLMELDKSEDFVSTNTLTDPESDATNPILAGLCLLVALTLALTGPSLALAMLTGALGMVLSDVLSITEAYEAVDWKTVFLLAGLIPLGIAMNQTGTAEFVADSLLKLVQGYHSLVILTGIGLLTMVFSLLMSNVAATILMVPLVIQIGTALPIDLRGLVILVGISATNSFLLPTHQVNALIMSPGDYTTSDFMKAGSGLTLIYLTISVLYVYWVY
jgi:di/tricarboxylate transporter